MMASVITAPAVFVTVPVIPRERIIRDVKDEICRCKRPVGAGKHVNVLSDRALDEIAV